MAEEVAGRPATERRPTNQFNVNDRAVLTGSISAVDGEYVTFTTDPANVPGSSGYQQSIRLHCVQIVKV